MKKTSLIIGSLVLILIAIIAVVFFPSLRTKLKELVGYQIPQEVKKDPNIIEQEGQLVEGFPEFPVYGDAVLVKSASLVQPGTSSQGYRAEWRLSQGSVPEVMAWYIEELKVAGWDVEESVDPEGYGEQISKASKGEIVAYLRVELLKGGEIEIEVDMPITNE